MAGDRVVKQSVLERDGEEISWTEEINPFRDIPQTAGVQIDEVMRTRLLMFKDGEQDGDKVFGGLQSLGLAPRRMYTRDLEFINGWWMVQTHPQRIVDNRVRVPDHGQYLVDGGRLSIKKNGIIWLERGAKLTVRK